MTGLAKLQAMSAVQEMNRLNNELAAIRGKPGSSQSVERLERRAQHLRERNPFL
jgi:hypothetical protein